MGDRRGFGNETPSPNWPFAAKSHQNASPVAVTAPDMLVQQPPAIDTTVPKPLTVTGMSRLGVVPSASTPFHATT